jgi:hypothetical protein
MKNIKRSLNSRSWLLAAAVLAVGLAGCQNFFTSSLASALARASLPIPTNLSPSDAAALAAQAKANGDTKLAAALVSSLVDQIGTTTDPAVKAALEAAAASAAVTASGLGSTLGSVLSNGLASDTSALLAAVQAGTSPDVLTALAYLDPSTGGLATGSSTLGATDYLVAAAVVAASAMPAGTNPSTFTPTTPAEQASIDSATSILAAGATTIAADPSSTTLYDQLAGAFNIPTV